VRDLPVPFGDVLVGVAEARGHHANQDLMILRTVEVGFYDLPLPGLLHEQGRFGLHSPPLR
jgi:hypothetical protein